jgi:hypothetical protein
MANLRLASDSLEALICTSSSRDRTWGNALTRRARHQRDAPPVDRLSSPSLASGQISDGEGKGHHEATITVGT